MVGLRGVGKTVLLNRLLVDGGGRGFECVLIEAPEDRSLPGTLAGPLNSALIRMSRGAAAKEPARRARRALAGFVGAIVVATPVAVRELDSTFFRVRLERTTPFERRYLRAMAELGPGPHRSGAVATALGRPGQGVAPTRARLVKKGIHLKK